MTADTTAPPVERLRVIGDSMAVTFANVLQIPGMEIINNGIPVKFDVTVNELQAQNCLEMMWMKNLSEQDEKITSPVLAVDAANEENLAGSMHDRDADDSWNIPW